MRLTADYVFLGRKIPSTPIRRRTLAPHKTRKPAPRACLSSSIYFMAIVIVCTSDKLHESISKVDKKYRHTDNLQRYVAPVLTDFFLNSSASSSLRTSVKSEVYSCTIESLVSAFEEYIEGELSNHPNSRGIIVQVRGLILELLRSDWPINNNLVVQECLEKADFFA